MTTAHSDGNRGILVGDVFTCDDKNTGENANLGPVERNTYEDSTKKVDAVLIEYNRSHAEAYHTRTTAYDLPIVGSSTINKDDHVYILGFNKLLEADVLYTNVSIGGFANLMQFSFSGSDRPVRGDSGAAVCKINKDRNGYEIVGLFKGETSGGRNGHATKWDAIADKYGVEVY